MKIKHLCAGLCLATSFTTTVFADSREEKIINPAWKFKLDQTSTDFQSKSFDDSSWENVALPHTLKETTLGLDDCMDSKLQETFHRYNGFYRKTLNLTTKDTDQNYFLQFQGAMQTLELWVNNQRIGKYERSGYDSFHFDVTNALKAGENIIAIKVDNHTNEVTPPDGKKMAKDFVLFGGLYRDVSLVKTGKVYVNFPWEARDAGVRITFPNVAKEASSVKIATTVKNSMSASVEAILKTEILDAEGNRVVTLSDSYQLASGKVATITQDFTAIKGLKLWHPDTPYLYTARSVISVGDKETDCIKTRFGVRSIKFTTDKGFFINGEHLKLNGSNRHQTWPFIGNALPNSLHRKDAEIIKNCGMNWIRLSHYPHDPEFLDACDELGIMLLEEGPTWMRHNGDVWLKNLLYSFRSMIRRDRNHPSIIVWNCCINHSGFNKELGQACIEEDSRPVGAKLPRTPMDFRHGKISGGGALTIEHTGHTYPRGRGEVRVGGIDGEWELTKRHWEHVSASYAKDDNAGMAVWAMFDYNTFHNVDEKGIVWHGVNDLTRIPKHSYFWYKSELTDKPMAYVINYRKGKACVFSNCQKVELFENTGSGFKSLGVKEPIKGLNLKHPPFEFDVSTNAIALKAVALNGTEKKAEHTWNKAGLPTGLSLKADSSQLIADGSDLTRIVATVVDSKGAAVPQLASQVYFKVKGSGTIVGPNPAPIRAGKAVVLVRSHYDIEKLEVIGESPGLNNGSATISCIKPASNVLMPEKLPLFEAKSMTSSKEFAWLSDLSWIFQQSQGQRWGRRFGLCGLANFKHNGTTYNNVIHCNAPAKVIYSLAGLYKKMSVKLVAMPEVSYKVILDGKTFCEHKELTANKEIEIPLAGVQTLELYSGKTANGTKSKQKSQAIWAEAKLFYGKEKEVTGPLFDVSTITDLTGTAPSTAEKVPAPNPVVFKAVKKAKKGSYVTSNIVMISGGAKSYPISVKNCEYRIYSEPWTSKPGKVVPGDAVTIRLKATGKKNIGKISIGGYYTTFKVMTK